MLQTGSRSHRVAWQVLGSHAWICVFAWVCVFAWICVVTMDRIAALMRGEWSADRDATRGALEAFFLGGDNGEDAAARKSRLITGLGAENSQAKQFVGRCFGRWRKAKSERRLRRQRFAAAGAVPHSDHGAAPFREIRAVQNAAEDTVRLYQAYNAAIADAAVAANSFQAPLRAGLWSRTRMTWVKPSAVWMAYRCGWSTKKDRNQARVLALDVSRPRWLQLLRQARLSHGTGKAAKCRDGSVTVQWDPEREMDPCAPPRQVMTRPLRDVRSIQVGPGCRSLPVV